VAGCKKEASPGIRRMEEHIMIQSIIQKLSSPSVVVQCEICSQKARPEQSLCTDCWEFFGHLSKFIDRGGRKARDLIRVRLQAVQYVPKVGT
jgi:hypothetical protein